MIRVARFLSSYVRHPGGPAAAEEVEVPSPEGPLPATLYRPSRAGPLPGWVVLHGITVPGRRHKTLQRFARSLAGSGGMVLVPEIRAWTQLRVDSAIADRAIAASAAYLAGRGDVRPGGVGVVGFSFGATQALITAAAPQNRESIRTVVGFGGYADLPRTLLFMFTGEHEWQGVEQRLEPDPYGRWIAAANFLTAVPEFRHMRGVAEASHRMAEEAGLRGTYAGEPSFDALKAELRATLQPDEREIWDVVAPPVGARPDAALQRDVAERLGTAALLTDPGLDPREALSGLAARVVLAHGVADHLVPFTESLRMRTLLPRQTRASVALTRLFAHSTGAPPLRSWEYPVELFRYLRLLHRALGR